MGFNFGFGKKKKVGKAIRTYVGDRAKEKRAFEQQLGNLNVWLQGQIINQETYQRMKDALEVNFTRQRYEALACLQNTFMNTFPI